MEKNNKIKKRKDGSLNGEMRARVRDATKAKSDKTKRNYQKACSSFDKWRKTAEISNKQVRNDPRAAVEQWAASLTASGYSASTIHTYVAGACCGLGIKMDGIVRGGTAADKRKSIGRSERAERARESTRNADIVKFQELVGGRRSALQRLTGADLVLDESGEVCVRFIGDKGGKTQYQRLDPDKIDEIIPFFAGKDADEPIFPAKIDKNLDLHGIRAEHARAEYERYAQICSTPEGREEMRRQLWRRYTDPHIGNKAYLAAKETGNKDAMRAARMRFWEELRPGQYHLRGANKEIAELRGRPTRYDRLALCCVSVFALSHWRNEVTVKHYML